MSDRCEPPPELRGVDGWHWVETHHHGQQPWFWYWLSQENRGFWRGVVQTHRRYLAPVTTPAEVDALRAERDRLEATALNAAGQVDNLRAIAAASQAELTTLRARVARLQEALKPFAAAGLWDWNVTVWRGVPSEQAQILYHDGTKESITLADLHAARAALSAETP